MSGNKSHIKQFSQVEENTKHFLNLKNQGFLKVSEFHGHVCPGSAIGYKAAAIAINELSNNKNTDGELVCITENDTCAVDAIQVVTGCTLGKGNLIFHDYGKQVYTFINRETGDAVRLSMNEAFNIDNIAPDLGKLRKKVNSGKGSKYEKAELRKIINSVSEEIINLPDEEVFNVEHVEVEIPSKARMFNSHKCSECGEMVSDHKQRVQDGNILCIPCFNKIKNN